MPKYNIDLSVSELRSLIDEWILSERDRQIMKRRLLDGLTYERLAEEFDLSDAQIKRIIYKNMDKLVPHLPRQEPKVTQKSTINATLASC
jgi:DNA-directed RNA polymerase sigma subunit (sigma70/sigma32)